MKSKKLVALMLACLTLLCVMHPVLAIDGGLACPGGG